MSWLQLLLPWLIAVGMGCLVFAALQLVQSASPNRLARLQRRKDTPFKAFHLDPQLLGKAGVRVLAGVAAALITLPLAGWLTAASLGLLVAYSLPLIGEWWHAREKRKHQQRVEAALPHLVDHLLIAAHAGLGLRQALEESRLLLKDRDMVEQLDTVSQDLAVGYSMAEALRRWNRRFQSPLLHGLTQSLIQGQARGLPVESTLQSQAERIRSRQQHRVEAAMEQVPTKMTVVSLLLLFPSLFVVLILPSLLNFIDSGW